jgi:hypothetical protein
MPSGLDRVARGGGAADGDAVAGLRRTTGRAARRHGRTSCHIAAATAWAALPQTPARFSLKQRRLINMNPTTWLLAAGLAVIALVPATAG